MRKSDLIIPLIASLVASITAATVVSYMTKTHRKGAKDAGVIMHDVPTIVESNVSYGELPEVQRPKQRVHMPILPPTEARSWPGIVMHHSGSEHDSPESIHRYHTSKGWNGIGYHIVIARDGTIVFTHRWTQGISGAHCRNYNKMVGICVLGDLNKRPMYRDQNASLTWLLRTLVDVNEGPIKLHKELGSTLCPGEQFVLPMF